MLIGLIYDLKSEYVPRPDDPADANAEFDSPGPIEIIAGAIRSAGHDVVMIGGVEQLLRRRGRLGVDLVVNIAEGSGGRNRESQVPMVLELDHIPYVGSDALTLGVSLDKIVAKRVFRAEGLPTPRWFQIRDIADLLDVPLPFPLIVKPRHEGSSKGLSETSVVRSREALLAQVDWLIRTYRQPALVEEFIPGTEFTVAVIGNDPPEAQPVVQIAIDGKTALGDLFYNFARLDSTALTYVCPAKIPPALEQELQTLAVRAYQAIECRDFGRVDFRVDTQGRPYVLEINPLPSLSTDDVFMTVARHFGVAYDVMIHRILNAAIARHRLEPCPFASR